MYSNNSLSEICFPHSHKPRKNVVTLAGTVLNKPEFLKPSRDAQNVCAVAKGDTRKFSDPA